jgi:hypothetical protein
VAPRPEVLGNGPIGREEALGVARGLESRQAPFALAGGLVRVCGPILEGPVLSVLHAREYLPLGGPIAFERVRNAHAGCICCPLQELAANLLGRVLVAPALHQEIQEVTVLIHPRHRECRSPWRVRKTSSRGHSSPGCGRRRRS